MYIRKSKFGSNACWISKKSRAPPLYRFSKTTLLLQPLRSLSELFQNSVIMIKGFKLTFFIFIIVYLLSFLLSNHRRFADFLFDNDLEQFPFTSCFPSIRGFLNCYCSLFSLLGRLPLPHLSIAIASHLRSSFSCIAFINGPDYSSRCTFFLIWVFGYSTWLWFKDNFMLQA